MEENEKVLQYVGTIPVDYLVPGMPPFPPEHLKSRYRKSSCSWCERPTWLGKSSEKMINMGVGIEVCLVCLAEMFKDDHDKVKVIPLNNF